MFLAFIGIFLVVFAVIGFGIFLKIRSVSPNNKKILSLEDDIQSAQDFVSFLDIKDNALQLDENNFRAFIEVGSLNYFLRTSIEQDMIEKSFTRFLNSLKHDIYLYIQTRALSTENVLKSLQADLEKVLQKYPQLNNYAEIYINGISNLGAVIGGNLNKRTYLIVPYDAGELTNLSAQEKYKYAIKELHTRVKLICNGLGNCGLSAKQLSTKDIMELIVAAYHRTDKSALSNIIGCDFAQLAVEESMPFRVFTPMEKLENIITEFSNRLSKEINIDELPVKVADNFREFLTAFEQLAAASFLKPNKGAVKINNPFRDDFEFDLGAKKERNEEYDDII